MRITTIIALAFAFALTVCGAARAQVDTTVAAQLTADERQRLETALDELQDVITQLSYQDTMSHAETDELRRSLAGLYRDLSALRGQVAGYPPADDSRANVWTRFGDAALRLNPQTARYTGWQLGNSIRVSYGDAGVIYLTVENGPYTARWTLRNAYRGAVQTSVKAETNGDVRLTVTDNRGNHEFLIKDGGLGPIYSRNLGSVGDDIDVGYTPRAQVVDGRTAGVWYRIYRDQVSRRQIADSVPMTWMIQQYQDNGFVNAKLRDFGVVLGELEGTPISQEPIGVIKYERNGRNYELDVPDPRRTPSEFASVIRVLYDLDKAEAWYEFELPTLDR